MTARRALSLLAILAAPLAVQARIWSGGNPPGIHGDIERPQVEVRGWITGFKLTGRHGRSVEVKLPRPLELGERLELPTGPWSELTLRLSGPVEVQVSDAAPVKLWLESLVIPLEDPDATEVRLSWSLPEGAESALLAGLTPDGLADLLQDGALAESLNEDSSSMATP